MVARFLGFMGLTCKCNPPWRYNTEQATLWYDLSNKGRRADVVVLAFSGICFCLWTLGRATWTVKQIIWLMLQIWVSS